MSEIKFDDSGLNKLIKSVVNDSNTSVKVGIIGEKAGSRDDGEMSNAEIGFIHEFGNKTHPMRSFLRFPILLKLKDKIEKNSVSKDGEINFKFTMYQIGLLAESVIDEAFETRGFGLWKPSQKHHGIDEMGEFRSTLVDTSQLRDSISSEVV